MRHAKSSWSDPTLTDHERPLAPRGRRDAKRIAKHLIDLGVTPELVLCSSAKRTRETLKRVERAFAGAATVTVEAELYGASAEALLERVRIVPGEVASLMLIGHNPGLQDLGLLLASTGPEVEQLEAKFPTAALATLTVPESWSRLSRGDAVLASYVVPKQLG